MCGWLPPCHEGAGCCRPFTIICFHSVCTQVCCATRFHMSSLSSLFSISKMLQTSWSFHTRNDQECRAKEEEGKSVKKRRLRRKWKGFQWRADVVRDAGQCGSCWEYEVSDCVPVFVSDLTLLPGPVVESALVSFSNSDFRFCVSRTLSLSEKRGASGTLLCDQKKKASMNVEGSTARQGSARSGQEQAHTAKCDFQSSTTARQEPGVGSGRSAVASKTQLARTVI